MLTRTRTVSLSSDDVANVRRPSLAVAFTSCPSLHDRSVGSHSVHQSSCSAQSQSSFGGSPGCGSVAGSDGTDFGFIGSGSIRSCGRSCGGSGSSLGGGGSTFCSRLMCSLLFAGPEILARCFRVCLDSPLSFFPLPVMADCSCCAVPRNYPGAARRGNPSLPKNHSVPLRPVSHSRCSRMPYLLPFPSPPPCT